MNDLEAPNLLRPSDALNRVQGVLLDRSRNPMERLHAVWADLQHVDLEELPPALRRDWSALAARARRLAEVDLQSAEAADFGEAADIASIVLCLEGLLFQNIMPAMES